MTTRLKYVNPMHVGAYFAIINALLSLAALGIEGVVFLFSAVFNPPGPFRSLLLMLLMPVFYAAFGLIVGVVSGWLYNGIAHFTGGIEVRFETKQQPAAAQTIA